jgi:hypothetical protein
VHGILTTEGEFRIWSSRRQSHFLLRSASLRASLRRKEKGWSFLYPAFTGQRVRKTAPTLTRHAGLLSAAPPGLVSRSLTIDSHF